MLRHLLALTARTSSRPLFAKPNASFCVCSRRAVSGQKPSATCKTTSSSSQKPSQTNWKMMFGLLVASSVSSYWLGRTGVTGEEKLATDPSKPASTPSEPVDAATQFFKDRKTRPLAIYEGSGRVRTYLPITAGSRELEKICDELKQHGIAVEHSETDRAAYDFYCALDRPLLSDTEAFDRMHEGVKRIIDLEKNAPRKSGNR